MDILFGTIDKVEHIYIPDGAKLDERAYDTLSRFIALKSISITQEQYNPSIKTRYEREIREQKK